MVKSKNSISGALLFVSALLAPLLPGLSQAQQVDVYSRPLHYERSHDYDVLHYRINLSFDLSSQSFWGDTTITLRPLRDDFTECVLDAETFKVSKVEMAVGGALQFEQQPSSLIVHLPHSYKYGQTLSFTVSYREDRSVADPLRHGMPASYDLGLTFKSATAEHPQMASTLSYPEGARHWFPCYDTPDDKATMEVIANVDQSEQAISNGRLLGVVSDKKNNRRIFHWSQEKPISTYLFVLVVGPYVRVTDHIGDLPVDYWVYAQDVPDARLSFHNTPEMIRFFSKEFNYPYPWAKYDQIILPHFRGGAESTSATVVGDDTIHDANAIQDFPEDSLVAHELAHQWWGDLVTMRDWSQAWLNEGFATYFQNVYTRHQLGDDEGALDLENKINAYLRETHDRYERPIVLDRWNVPNDNWDRHTYEKAAAVLNMLDWVMGDKEFLRALSYFLHKHAYQPVDTTDLEKAIIDSTGQNLNWFFDEWVFKAGHPVFDVSYKWDEEAKKVTVTVIQTQKTSEWVPIFQTPVVIAITTASGKQTSKVWIREQEEHFLFPCPEKPLLVRFDEGSHVLKEMTFPKSVEELTFQLRHDDVIGRMWAASQLSQHLDDSGARSALAQSAAGDPFWAVREKALTALGPSLRSSDIAFLKERALDSKSAVRVAALRLLGDLHEHSLNTFFQNRYHEDNSYVAEAETLRSIGKCGDSSNLQFLQEAGLSKSPGNIVHLASEEALKMIER
jgi:aminopeptidase N